MIRKKKVVVGTIGAGYAAALHGNGYKKVSGVEVVLKTICDLNTQLANKIRDEFGYSHVEADFQAVLADPEIDVIDIVLPPFLHVPVAVEALKAGKHVICEKPLTGYFGPRGQENVGKTVPKAEMYKSCVTEMDKLAKVIAQTDRKFMYAENFVYATPVQKAAEIIRAKQTKILFMKGEESLKGSSSPVAGFWNKTGGGTLIRTGTHPLSGMLWLKNQEAQIRGEKITISSVNCDVGVTTAVLTDEEHKHISARPQDVEDYGVISITFSDGTKALCIASDTVLGGTKNYIEIYGNNTALNCNITPTDLLNTYFWMKKVWRTLIFRKCCRQNLVGIRHLLVMKSFVDIWENCRTLWNVSLKIERLFRIFS